MIVKGSTEDVFWSMAWTTPKALSYWKHVAAQDLMLHLKQMEGFTVGSVKGE